MAGRTPNRGQRAPSEAARDPGRRPTRAVWPLGGRGRPADDRTGERLSGGCALALRPARDRL